MKTMQKLLGSGLLVLLFTSCVFGQYSGKEEYLVACDAVRIQIWQLWETSGEKSPVSNLGGEYVIDTNGNIFMPFVGLVKVEGKTPDEVATIIKGKYEDFLKEPFIYVRPLIRITLAGSVLRPGSYRIDPRSSLWDLLDMAGGPSSAADLKKISVVRGGNKVIKNLLKAFEKAYSLKEIGVQSGDQIIVPQPGGFNLQSIVNYLNLAVSLFLLYMRFRDRSY